MWIGLASVLVGSATECQTVLRFEDDEPVSTSRTGNGGAPLGMRHPTRFESIEGMRLEMFGVRGDVLTTTLDEPEEIEDLERLGSMTLEKTTHGRWWSFGQYSSRGGTSLDLVGAVMNDYFQGDLVEYATTTNEGHCSLTIPWLADDMDPALEALFGDAFGQGLAQVIVDGFNRGMAPRLGAQDVVEDQAWFADFSSSLSPDLQRPTQLVADWNVDQNGAAHHRACIRSYFFFDGSIDWSPSGAGEVFQWIAGGWIPNVFRIGDCPGNRGTAITVCGRFDVTRAGDQVYQGSELVAAVAGELTFRVDQVRAWVNRYPKIRIACNSAKPDIERGIEDVFASLIGPSFGAMAADFTNAIPFGLQEVHQSAEGLTLVIAIDEDDPDTALADWLGLCEPRMPQNGTYSNVLWEAEPSGM